MNTDKLEAGLKRSTDHLKTMRDSFRVSFSLAEMDARDEWKRLRARLPSLVALAGDVERMSAELKLRLQEAGRALKGKGPAAAKSRKKAAPKTDARSARP